jgi:Kdo2-lipid IVA lauroyltransferase/acyltransferase
MNAAADKAQRQKTLSYNLITRIFITPFLFCVKVWPLWISRPFSWFVTAVYYPFITIRRHNFQDNLRHILGHDTPNFVLFKKTFRMLVNYAYYLIDLFRFDEAKKQELLELLSGQSGYERLLEVLAEGRGAILMTAHLGNWELGGIILSKLGHPVNIVYFPDVSGRIDRSRTRQRMVSGIKEIRLEPGALSPIAMMRALQRGEVVALQGDKLFHDPGLKVRFFDAPAYFPKGPVQLSMTTGAPIVPSFIVIDKNGRYNIIVEEPIYPESTGDRAKDIEENLKRVVAALEKNIGRYHEQWYCLTRFWEE